MESEPNRPSDLMRAGFITDTIASCDGPVNEHQIVVCERQETLNVIDGLIQQKLREDTDLLYRFRRIEIGPPPNEDPSLAAFWKSIIEAQIEAGADADAQNAITRWEEDGESNPQQYSLLPERRHDRGRIGPAHRRHRQKRRHLAGRHHAQGAGVRPALDAAERESLPLRLAHRQMAGQQSRQPALPVDALADVHLSKA